MTRLVARIKPWVTFGFMLVPVVGILATWQEYVDPSSALTIYEKTHSTSCSGQLFYSLGEQVYVCIRSGIPTVLALNSEFPLKYRTNSVYHIALLAVFYSGGLIAWGYMAYDRLSFIARWLRLT